MRARSGLVALVVVLIGCSPGAPPLGRARQALVGTKIDLSFTMPMVDGRNDSVGMGTRQVPAAKVAQMIVDNELDIEATVAFYNPDETNIGDILGGYDSDEHLFSPIGVYSFSVFSYMRNTYRSVGIGYQPYGCDVKIRAWEKPDSGKGGLRGYVNGCQILPDVTWVPEEGTLPAITSLWAMSRNGTSTYLPGLLEDGPWAWHGDDNAHRPEGMVFGDSIIDQQYNFASYDRLGLCSRLYTMAETRSRDGLYNFAAAGAKIQDQQALFDGSDLAGCSSTPWSLSTMGINNILYGDDGPTLIGHYQDFLDDVCAANAGTVFVAEAMMPDKQYLDDFGGENTWRHDAWVYANAAIMGTLESGNLAAPEGCTLYRSDAASQAMNDGNHGGTADNLWASRDSGDHIHPTVAGRIEIAELERLDLAAAGALP